MEEKNKKIIFVMSLALIFILAVVFFGQIVAKKEKQTKENDTISKASTEFKLEKEKLSELISTEGNYQKIIEKTNSLLENKQFAEPGQEVNLELILATAYVNSLGEDNFKKGIDIFKRIAVDNNPPILRAASLEYLASFSQARGKDFAQNNIFNDQAFASFMKEQDLSLAVRKLDEWSLMLAPSPIPYYRISEWYSLQLIQDNKLSQDTKAGYLQMAKENLKKGRDLFEEKYSKGVWQQQNERLALAYLLYGKAATKLYLLGELEEKDKIIDVYEKALEIYKKEYGEMSWPFDKNKITSPALRGQLPGLVYNYAFFLTLLNDTTSQEKAKSLLEILYDNSWNEPYVFNFFDSLKNEKDMIDTSTYNRWKIISLAKFDKRFVDLLVSLDWKEEQLQTVPVLPGLQK
jgi:hypothetical protein